MARRLNPDFFWWLLHRADVWLGKLIPWWVLRLAERRLGLCWVKLVSMKTFGPWGFFITDRDSLRVTTTCFNASPEPYDYCNTHGPEHPCFKQLVADRARAERVRQFPEVRA